MRIISIIGPEEAVVSVDVNTNEESLLELLGSIFNINITDIKGLRDVNGVHFTLNSVVSNQTINSQRSNYFHLVCTQTVTKMRQKVVSKRRESIKKKPEVKRRKSLTTETTVDSKKIIIKNLFARNELSFEEYRTLNKMAEEGNERMTNLAEAYLDGSIAKEMLAEKLRLLVDSEKESPRRLGRDEMLQILQENKHNFEESTYEILVNLCKFGNDKLCSLLNLYSFEEEAELEELVEDLKMLANSYKSPKRKGINSAELIKKLNERLHVYQSAVLKGILKSEQETFKNWIEKFKDEPDESKVINYVKMQVESVYQNAIIANLSEANKLVLEFLKTHLRNDLNAKLHEIMKTDYDLSKFVEELERYFLEFDKNMRAGKQIETYLKITPFVHVSDEAFIKERLEMKDPPVCELFGKFYLNFSTLTDKLNRYIEENLDEFDEGLQNVSHLSLEEEEELQQIVVTKEEKDKFKNKLYELNSKGYFEPAQCETIAVEFGKGNKTVASAWKLYQQTKSLEELAETLQLVLENQNNTTFNFISPIQRIAIPEEDSQSEDNHTSLEKLPSRDTITERREIHNQLKNIISNFFSTEKINMETYREGNKLIDNETPMVYSIFEAFGSNRNPDDFLLKFRILIEVERKRILMRNYGETRNLPPEDLERLIKIFKSDSCAQLQAVFKCYDKTNELEDFYESLDVLLTCL